MDGQSPTSDLFYYFLDLAVFDRLGLYVLGDVDHECMAPLPLEPH